MPTKNHLLQDTVARPLSAGHWALMNKQETGTSSSAITYKSLEAICAAWDVVIGEKGEDEYGTFVRVLRATPANSPRVSAYLGLERLAEESEGRASADLRARIDAAWEALTPDEVRWIRARQSNGVGPFEDSARRRKVLKLLAFVPMAGSNAENEVCADWLTRMSVPERAIFAKVAGANAPSDETWRQLVEAVKARKTIGEVDEIARRVIR